MRPVREKPPVEWVIARLGNYTDDAILITEAEPVAEPGPRIVWCNPAFTKMTGYALEDVRGLTPRLLQGEDTDRNALDRVRGALETWRPVRVDLKNYRKDGSAFWVDLGIYPVEDEKGWFHYWVAIQREMPTRDASDLHLRRANTVAEQAPVALALIDRDNQLIFANDFFRQLIFADNLPPALPMPYDAWLKRGGPKSAQAASDVKVQDHWVDHHVAAILSSRNRVEQQLDGRWYEFRRIPIDNGEQLLIGENIDGKIALQDQVRQMAKLDAMGQLTGGVAHDFNNLLAVILGNAELADMDEISTDEKSELIGEIISAAKKGRSLTQSLLSFARKSIMSPETVCVEAQVSEAVAMFRRVSGAALRVAVHVEQGLPPISIDASLLQNALLNLLLNAKDATEMGGEVTVSVAVDPDSVLPNLANDAEGAEVVMISVSDQGAGMSEDVAARAIEPFFSTKAAGSGLGLSMVHGFVDQSGGRLDIKSVPGAGTTVSMRLPSLSPIEQLSENAEKATSYSLKGYTVLLAEDEVSLRRLLTRILENAGARVFAYESGDDAFRNKELWGDVDLLLSDVIMPGSIQGDTLARLFANTCGEKPIVLLTGNPDMVRELMQTTEQFELLVKPVERTVLLATLSALLNGPKETPA